MKKYFINANDAELQNVTYICETVEEMQRIWNELGDDVQSVQVSNNGVRTMIFERCW